MRQFTVSNSEWIADVEHTARSVILQNQRSGQSRPVEMAASEVLKLVAAYRDSGHAGLIDELANLKAPEFDDQSARFDRIDKLIRRFAHSAPLKDQP